MINQEAKKQAAIRALQEVKPGQILGLGTGSTVFFFLELLGERVREEGLQIQALASSKNTESLAQERGIPLLDVSEKVVIDLYIDGADEVDPRKNMIKGGGGALFREKILAFTAEKCLIMVDPSKCVDCIGGALLPLEILHWASWTVERHLASRGLKGHFRKGLSDNGNLLFDLEVPELLQDPPSLDRSLKEIPGILETGLFYGLDPMVIIGYPEGRSTIE